MNRWFWKRWIWAVLVGTTAAVGLTMAQQGGTDAPSGPPKVGDVITLKFRDLPDRQVKVLKSEKQPDGSILSEVKDTKSGETFTLMDKPDPATAKPDTTPKPAVSKAAPKAVEPTKSAEPPKVVTPPKIQDGPFKAKSRTSDPLVPPLKDALPNLPKEKDQEQEKEKERRFFPSLGKSNAAPAPSEPEEEKPGLLKRVFGRKKPNPPATPTPPASPSAPTSSMSAKPVASPSTPSPLPTVPRTSPTVTLEPPRTQPVRPVEPPTPLTPVPVSLPTGPTAPSIPTPPPAASPPSPIPLPLPAIPSVPGVGIPGPGGLPSIPIPPSGMSVNGPMTPIAPAPMKPVAVAAKPTVKETKAPVTEAVKETVVVVSKQLVAIAPMPSDVVTAARMVPALAPVVNVPVTPQDSAVTAMMRDIETHVKALENGIAPSQRAMAARAMCGGRHGSSDTVKMTVFRAAQKDPNPMVRAVCIEELCKLGYFEPAFELYLTKACDDSSEEVRKAAKTALTQMAPRR